MKINLTDKKVIITGGSTGIGKEVVKLFAENKSKIALFDVNDSEGSNLSNELNKKGSEIRYWHLDVRDSNQVSGGVLAANQWLGGVDILINLAGILQGASLDIEKFPNDIWESVIGVNLTGSYLMVKHVSEIDEWWTGSRDFLGEVADLYGKPKPIPPDRVISADEGFVLNSVLLQ